MRKSWVMPICMFSVTVVGMSQAVAQDSRDIVYIDGKPCNSLCQSYMAWSRKTLSTQAPRASAARPVAGIGRSSKAALQRMGKFAGDVRAQAPIAGMHHADAGTDNSPAKAMRGPAGIGTAIAQQATPAMSVPAPNRKGPDAAPASANDADRMVALLIARPEITSMPDLSGKSIAIDDAQSRSNSSFQRAIVAAGAAEVQLSAGQTKALDRLINGEVPAAVLTLAYPEAAEWSSDIAGFKVFRVPLAPRSLHAGPQPAGNPTVDLQTARASTGDLPHATGAVADARARTLLDLVAAATAVAKQMTAAATHMANSERSVRGELRSEANASTTASSNDVNPALVALLMVQPDIRSVTDLTGKVIAIDGRQSSLNADVRTAIVAAGAAQVQLSESEGKAVNRLISAEVPAAVLALVSAEAADGFPDIKGFRIFRIPLSPRSLEPQAAAPFDAAAAAADGKLKQEVKVATAIAEYVMSQRAGAKAGPASPNDGEPMVAVLLVRPEIGSISDLTGKIVAIDDRHSDFNSKVQAAIAAAGATGVQLSEGPTNAMDRLISGEASAAILTLIYPHTGFAEITGFKVFRIPL